eukprot:7715041-Alexandrium_andersonii.AAC.1
MRSAFRAQRSRALGRSAERPRPRSGGPTGTKLKGQKPAGRLILLKTALELLASSLQQFQA